MVEPAKKKVPKKEKVIIEPFKLMAIARSGHGKTFKVLDILREKVASKQVTPKRIIMFSPTANSDPLQLAFQGEMQKLTPGYKFKENNVFDEIQYPFLEKLFNGMKKLKEDGKKVPHWILFFDDQIAVTSGKALHPIMVKIACIGRHVNLSQCWMLQIFRSSINPVLREQISHILCGDLQSDDAKLDICKQFSSGFDPDPRQSARKLFAKLSEVVQEDDHHGFLYIKTEVPMGKGRFQIGLSDRFLDK